jgi:hypothetical protein
MMAMIGARGQFLASAHTGWSSCQHPCGPHLPRTAHRAGDGYFVANSSCSSFCTPPAISHDVCIGIDMSRVCATFLGGH